MFAWPTASPYVFVTRTAVVTAGVDHTQLFREAAEPSYDQPSLFHNGRFEYLSSVSDGSSKKPLQLPPDSDVPEVAFLGRSNVGKSSLINALMRRDLARISKQPGRTQQVHLFGIVPRAYEPPPAHHHGAAAPDYAAAARGVFVDLPGYGFAVGPDDAVESWQVLTQRFLRTRRRDTGNLRRLFLLVDARHGTQTIDHFVMTWLEDNDIPYTVVLTKADCVGAPQIVRMVNQICLRYAAEVGHAADGDVAPAALYMSPIVHVTSAKGGRGLAELLSTIENEFLVRNDTDEDEKFSDDEDSSVDGDSSDEDDDDDDDDEDSSDDDDSQYNGDSSDNDSDDDNKDSSDNDSDDDKRPDGSVRPHQR
jgi:GTP-binding protein